MTYMNTHDAQLPVYKGHGTENDFVIIPDLDAKIELTPDFIAALCDRRSGIGGDGLLRVATAQALLKSGVLAALPDGVAATDVFMDYYNADGSTAQMCGNGTRVFAHWVRAHGIKDQDEFVVGTRAGARFVKVRSFDDSQAEVTVDMGSAEVTGVSTCAIGSQQFAGLGVDMGNPHLACVVPGYGQEDIENLDLVKPLFDPKFFPEGVNVEIATPLVQGVTHMRVFERGVGETRSCGTGTVATARAALADAGHADGEVVVVVPGGKVRVTIQGDESTLTGPSRIVASGYINLAGLKKN
ncbi:diaminopimelate epimerase [Corynebacterium diphtheriae]|nr:diaminopimelate epimerase [Corynebacterium diphtheriae]CAB0822338.1 diaminopimelate epimerase [Corynebacterium diphtheriae]CAB1051295.1 diaminopimelate epimerase [Corynebacterium diphtheriae]